MTTNIIQKRDVSIDILRFVGISLIVLAHVGPPDTVLNLRCFDVPLMLFVSGLTLSDRHADFSTRYFKHRAVRLLLPVYVFLTAYFILVWAVQSAGIDMGVRMHHVVGSYLLREGFGFVWIIRVLLLVALLTPPILYLKDKANPYLLLTGAIAVSVVLTVCIRSRIGMNNVLVRDYVYYGVGYSVPFIFGLIVPKLSARRLASISVVFLCLLFGCAVSLNIIDVNIESLYKIGGGGNLLIFNNYKYPPLAYYIFYGILMSLVSYLVIVKAGVYKKLLMFEFIGCNTIWLYLYHIPLVQLTGKLSLHWGIRFFIVYILAFLLTYSQVKLVSHLQSKYNLRRQLQFLKG